MPRPTVHQALLAIEEIKGLIKTQEARLDHFKDQVARIQADLEESRNDLRSIERTLATHQEKLARLDQLIERRDDRKWQVRMAVVAASLALLIQLVTTLMPFIRRLAHITIDS